MYTKRLYTKFHGVSFRRRKLVQHIARVLFVDQLMHSVVLAKLHAVPCQVLPLVLCARVMVGTDWWIILHEQILLELPVSLLVPTRVPARDLRVMHTMQTRPPALPNRIRLETPVSLLQRPPVPTQTAVLHAMHTMPTQQRVSANPHSVPVYLVLPLILLRVVNPRRNVPR